MYKFNLSLEDTNRAEWARSIISRYVVKSDKNYESYLASRKAYLYYGYAACLSMLSSKNSFSFSATLDEAEKFNPILKRALSAEISANILEPIVLDFLSFNDFNSVIGSLVAFINSDTVGYSDEKTPDSISQLSLRLLDVKDNEEVVDIGSGTGSFVLSAASMYPRAHFTGFEVSSERLIVSLMRAHINNIRNVDIIQSDAFDHADDRKFNKIFANYPFNMKLRFSGLAKSFLSEKSLDGNWAFNELARRMTCWSPHNKAVVIMPIGSTFNLSELQARRPFVQMGVIESVIALPNKLFEGTSVQIVLLVISFGHTSVRFVDASNFYSTGRRCNYLSESDIDCIVKACNADSDISKTVSLDAIAEENYCLTPSRYLTHKSVSIEDGVPFGSIIKSVTRGAQLSAAILDDLVSVKETNNQYLMLSNIQNGLISKELPYLSKLDDTLKKYCIEDDDLILSKNGAPYKVAIAHPEPGKKVLANGNLYVIKIDKTKANPIYVKAFFESELGIESLQRISMGSIVPNISLSELKNVMIPLPSLEKQNEFAERYTEQINKIEILKIKLDRAITELGGLFDDRT